MMSDHQDSEHFMGVRSEDEILRMLDLAERKKNKHHSAFNEYPSTLTKKARMYHMRNYKALEGVVKTLRWALGDLSVEHPLE
tara:strand:+ start:584 stop:829 length:246 start_codon:yes stop_codon:yes gene_type:complete